jgi:PAS domain S-box-containing protein
MERMQNPEISVLLIDDEPDFVDLLKYFLERERDIVTSTASDARVALEKLEGGGYDAVISDYQMPGMDGLGLLKILRAKGDDIPFILLTGRGREDVAVEALNLGADFYVQKHGDPKAMHAELANAVRQSVAKRIALESLKRSEKTYRQLVELAQEGIWVIDGKGLTTLVNPRLSGMLGYSKEELLGKSLFDFVGESWREKAADYFDRRMSGISEQHELGFVKKDGSVLHVLIGASPIVDENGKVVGGMAVVTDISDRAAAEAMVRKERDTARSYLDIAQAILLCLDSEGDVILVNRMGCEILGYEEDEIVGENWFDKFLPERIRADVRRTFSQVLGQQISVEGPVVNPVLTKSGEERLIRWHSAVLRDQAGDFVQTLSSGEDITEAWLAERRLQRELEESGAIATLSTMLISPTLSVIELSKIVLGFATSLTDSQHGFVSSVDPATRSVVSHTLTDMMEDGACGMVKKERPLEFPIGADGEYPSLWGHPLNTRKPFYTNSPAEHESSAGVPEGHIRLQNFLSVPVLYGDELVGQISVANSSRDYDDDDADVVSKLAGIYAVAFQRERDLASLVMAQSRFRSFMDNSPAVTYIKDKDGRYIFANRQYEDLLGVSEQSILGKTDEELWPEGTARQFRENDQKAISFGGSSKFIEAVPRQDGAHEYLSFKFPVADAHGRPTSLGGVSVDITDMRRFESALHLANQKLKMLGHLTRHDALNQLSMLRGWLSIAREASEGTKASDYMDKVSVSLDILTRQLEFAGEYEQIGMDSQEWMDLNEVCKEVWSEIETKDLVLDCQCDGVEVLVDPMFHTVIRNLIDNTIRHARGAKRVEISYKGGPESMTVVYLDDGVGIPPDAKERIFERGFGANTGLGLYMVRELLRTCEVPIEETGEPGKCARFEIRFPAGRYRLRTTAEEG